MKSAHHALCVEAAADLVQHWKESGGGPLGLDLEKLVDLLGNEARLRQIASWTARGDEIDDIVVDVGLASVIVELVSRATCFQHFTYCGSMATLEDGKKKVEKGDGYCWDCDPFMPWLGEIANISTTNVRHSADCGVLDPDFLAQSWGAKMIHGTEDWDNQLYPSAVKVAEFYGTGAEAYRDQGQGGHALRSLCFAIHLLQDLTVPHHVLCTVGLNHGGWEAEALRNWRLLYAMKNKDRKREIVTEQLSKMVADLIESGLGDVEGYEPSAWPLWRSQRPGSPENRPFPPAASPKCAAPRHRPWRQRCAR